MKPAPKLLSAAIAIAACLCLVGCTIRIEGFPFDNGPQTRRADGKPNTLTAALDEAAAYSLSIEGIHITRSGGIELHVDPQLYSGVTVSGPQNMLDSITVTTEGGSIKVQGDDRLRFTNGDIDITVGANLVALDVATGIELDAAIPDATDFSLNVDGAIDGEIEFGSLEALSLTINGAGSLDLSGRCAKATVIVNGASSIDAEELFCTEANVTINGAGSCEIYVTDTLDAAVNGVGSIRYSGNPATVNKSGGGIASISPDKEKRD